MVSPLRDLKGMIRGVLEVWQAKELQEGVFGSVANKGVTGKSLDVWQGKELGKQGGENGN